MSSGLRIPVGVNRQGGTSTVEGDDQADKIIRLALSDNDSDNAFQQGIGLGSAAIFSLRNPSFRSLVSVKLTEIFEAFERARLFKLVRTSLRFEAGGPGEQIVRFDFINLESDEVQSFSKSFKAAS